ncbi:MAG: aldo/keto reductase [bacterium]|nr:aldo/keto reductase [bacterium]
MKRRTLGQTGLEVSPIGLGAVSLGGDYGAVDETAGIAAVHRAFELGINFFDASPYYGSTRAETVLGRALRDLPRDEYVLATKAGRYGVDDFDFTPERLRRSLDESLARLQVDRLDLFLLHDVEFGDLDFIFRESLPVMRELRSTAKVGAIGITGLPLAIFERALAAQVDLDVVLSYCHATLFDQSLTSLAPTLEQSGVGVVNASAAAMGLLSSHGPPAWHPADRELRESCEAAASHCTNHGVELAELALSYTVTLPGPVTTLFSTASAEVVERNVRAATTPPDPELLAGVQRLLEPVRDRTWPQGLPANAHSPSN